MYWIFYILLPGITAWQKRSANLAKESFSFFGTMLSAYLAVWCEPLVYKSISTFLPKDKELLAWLVPGAMVLIWLITTMLLNKVIDMIRAGGVEGIICHEQASKFLTPAVVFFHVGLVVALLFTILSVSPAKVYVPFVFENTSMCSAARYRFLWNSFIIDRLSFQSISVTDRRRAFDRFVPAAPAREAQQVTPNRKAK